MHQHGNNMELCEWQAFQYCTFFCVGFTIHPPPIISVLQAGLSVSTLRFFNVPLFSCQVIIEEPVRLTPYPRQQRFRWEGRWCAYVRHTHTQWYNSAFDRAQGRMYTRRSGSLLFCGLCVFQRDLYIHTWLWHVNWSLISEYDQRSHTHTGRPLWRISKGVMVFIQK